MRYEIELISIRVPRPKRNATKRVSGNFSIGYWWILLYWLWVQRVLLTSKLSQYEKHEVLDGCLRGLVVGCGWYKKKDRSKRTWKTPRNVTIFNFTSTIMSALSPLLLSKGTLSERCFIFSELTKTLTKHNCKFTKKLHTHTHAYVTSVFLKGVGRAHETLHRQKHYHVYFFS